MRKAILHIGGHKTGTTAIQTALHRNAPLLKREGVSYPRRLAGGQVWFAGQHCVAYTLLGHELFSRKVRSTDEDPLAFLRDLTRERDLVLSSENFMKLDEESVGRLAECLAGFDCHVVLYVRRQDESAQALYQTDVLSAGYARSFAEYFAENVALFDYGAVARRWQGVFGPGSVSVRIYDRGRLHKGDAVDDFVGLLEQMLGRGLGLAGWERASEDINRGLPTQLVHLARYFNRYPQRHRIVPRLNDLGRRLYADKRVSYDLVAPSVRRMVLNTYAESNALLAREFLGMAEDGLFAGESIPETDQAWRAKYGWDGAHLALLLDDMAAALDDSRAAESVAARRVRS